MDQKKQKQEQQNPSTISNLPAGGENQGGEDRMRQPNRDRSHTNDHSSQVEPTPSFDEGERKPAQIESTGNDGVRNAVQGSPAGKKGRTQSDRGKHTEATMPPGEGQDPKRNTM